MLANTAARFAWAEDYPDGWSEELISESIELGDRCGERTRPVPNGRQLPGTRSSWRHLHA